MRIILLGAALLIPLAVATAAAETSQSPFVPPSEPYGPDILGIRLGMSMDKAESIVRENMKVGWVYERDFNDLVKKKSDLALVKPYLTLKAFISKDQKEAISLYSAPPASNKLIALARAVSLGKQDTEEGVMKALKEKYGTPNRMLSQPSSQTWSNVKGVNMHCKGAPSFRGTKTFIPLKLVEKLKAKNKEKDRNKRQKEPMAIPEVIANFWNNKTMPECLPALSTFFHRGSLLFGLVDHGPYSVYYQKNLNAIKQRINSQPLPPPSFKF